MTRWGLAFIALALVAGCSERGRGGEEDQAKAPAAMTSAPAAQSPKGPAAPQAHTSEGRDSEGGQPQERPGELPVLPEAIQARVDAGLAKVRANDHDGALEIFSALIVDHPDIFDPYDHRSMIYYNRQAYAEVAADCTKAIELARANGTFAITCPDRCLTRRGASYLNLEEWEKALADFDEVLQYRPNDGFTYFERGRAYYGQGKLAEARADFERALELAPNHRVVAEIAPHLIRKIDDPNAQ